MKRILFDLLVNVIASSKLTPIRLRYLLYKLNGINVETNNIFSGAYFCSNKVHIGKSTFINNNCYFENNGFVSIGDRCAIGMQVIFCTDTHKFGLSDRRAGSTIFNPIKVEDGCWIGGRVIILPGVTIKKGCIVAAGSVVTKDCEPNSLYAGVPAKRIKELY